MRTILLLLLLVTLISVSRGMDRVANLSWLPNPEPNITCYEVWQDGVLKASPTVPRLEVRLPMWKPTSFYVIAVNSSGQKSEQSDTLAVEGAMSAVKATVEFSKDMKAWTDKPSPEARFFRAKLESP